MYWDFPSVSADDRLDRSPALNPSTIHVSPAEAFAALGQSPPAGQVRLNIFDGRPVLDSALAAMIVFMLGGTALCVTSLILAWRVLGAYLFGGGVQRAGLSAGPLSR